MGADSEVVNRFGESSFDKALFDGFYLNQAANLDHWDGDHMSVIKVLIAYGVQLNIQRTNSRWTPLHYAAKYGSIGLVQLLLAHGARRDIQARNGKTALSLASNDACVALLKDDLTDGTQKGDESNCEKKLDFEKIN